MLRFRHLYLYLIFLLNILLLAGCTGYGGGDCTELSRQYLFLSDTAQDMLPAQPAEQLTFRITNDSQSYSKTYRLSSNMTFLRVRRDWCAYDYREEVRHLYNAVDDTTGRDIFSYSIVAAHSSPFSPPADFLLSSNAGLHERNISVFQATTDTLAFTLYPSLLWSYGSSPARSDSARIQLTQEAGILNITFYKSRERWEREF